MMSMISAGKSLSDRGCELMVDGMLLSLSWDGSDDRRDEAFLRAESSKNGGDMVE
jgi:hypothetical protein